MSSEQKQRLGAQGEAQAAEFLRSAGYTIVATNYRTRIGEIDIIARDKDTLVFVEVKSRKTGLYGLPKETVHLHKQRQLCKAALLFLKERKLLQCRARFDVVSVTYSGSQPAFELIANAFEMPEGYSY